MPAMSTIRLSLSVPNVKTTSELKTLNNSHPSNDFTIDLEENCRLPFLGMKILRNGMGIT